MMKFVGIAIDDYVDDSIINLNNCKNDVQKFMTAISSKFHFDDLQLLCEKEQTTKSSLYRTLSETLINALEEDSIVIYFAGHGEYNPKTESSYWVTSESSKNDATTWLSINELLNIFKFSPAKHIALISDSCFSGHIFDQERGGGYDNFTNKKSRYALTSGSLEKVKDGPPNANSPFSNILTDFVTNYQNDKLTFSELCEKTIIQFSELENQTPCYGSLSNCRHEGGVMVLETFDKEQKFQDLTLNLEFEENFEIECYFKIPSIKKSNRYNADFFNSFITQKGYSIINEARAFFIDEKYFKLDPIVEVMDFVLEVDYNIAFFSEKFISIIISRFDYFGGAHPNNYIYTLNFSFKPERLLTISELFDLSHFKSFHEFLDSMIYSYAEEDSKKILLRYVKFTQAEDLDFSFNEEKLTIYFINYMPRAVMAVGFLEIPIEDLQFR